MLDLLCLQEFHTSLFQRAFFNGPCLCSQIPRCSVDGIWFHFAFLLWKAVICWTVNQLVVVSCSFPFTWIPCDIPGYFFLKPSSFKAVSVSWQKAGYEWGVCYWNTWREEGRWEGLSSGRCVRFLRNLQTGSSPGNMESYEQCNLISGPWLPVMHCPSDKRGQCPGPCGEAISSLSEEARFCFIFPDPLLCRETKD